MFCADYGGESADQLDQWHSARLVPYGPLQIDPAAAVLHYGQELFEGLKAYRGVDGQIRLFRPEMNHARLVRGAERLCMVAPSKELFLTGLHELCLADERWIPNQTGTALYLRPTLIATEPFLGVRPSRRYLFFVIGSPVGSYYGNGSQSVRIKVETDLVRAAPGGIGEAKTGGNYAASLKAAVTAKEAGFAQVLWLDAVHRSYIEEVGTMNVFFKIAGRVVTPPLEGTILPGVTRQSVIELLKESGTPFEERKISLKELEDASARGALEEVFGTGTAASISPVRELGVRCQVLAVQSGDGFGPVGRWLFDELNGIQYGARPDRFGWTQTVRSE